MSYSYVSSDFYLDLEKKVNEFSKKYQNVLGLSKFDQPLTSIDIELLQKITINKIAEIINNKITPIHLISGFNKNETKGFSLSSIETIVSFDKNSIIV